MRPTTISIFWRGASTLAISYWILCNTHVNVKARILKTHERMEGDASFLVRIEAAVACDRERTTRHEGRT